MVNKPTHISGSLMDDVYIKKALMEEFFINANVENIFAKNSFFILIYKIGHNQVRMKNLLFFLDLLVILIYLAVVVNMAIKRDRKWG